MSEPYKFLKNMELQHYETPTDFFLDFHEQLELLQKETTKLKFELVGIVDRLRIKEEENARLRNEIELLKKEWVGL